MQIIELALILFAAIKAPSVVGGLSPVNGTDSPSDTAYLEADQFLTTYGYYYPSSGLLPAQRRNPSLKEHSGTERTKALKLFQKFYNLHQSGKLDNETKQLMQSRRCGNPDIISNVNTMGTPSGLELEEEADVSQIKKNHKNQDGEKIGNNVDRRRRSFDKPRARIMMDKDGKLYKWRSKNMTWAFLHPSKKVYGVIQSWVIRDTLKMWEKFLPIKFKEVKFPWMDLEVSFHSFAKKPNLDVFFNHSNRFVNGKTDKKSRSPGRPKRKSGAYSKDSPIAHAILPEKVSKTNQRHIHFDEDHDWGIVELWSVALHEIGHIVGLGHSSDPSAVMYPYNRDVTEFALDDLESIVGLYGLQDGFADDYLCKSKVKEVDAIIRAAEPFQYLSFTGDKFQRLVSHIPTQQPFALKKVDDVFQLAPTRYNLVFSAKGRHFNSIFFVAGITLHQYDLTTFEIQSKSYIAPEIFPETPVFAMKSPMDNTFTDETDTLLFGETYYWRFAFDGQHASYGGRTNRQSLDLDLSKLKFEVQWTNGDYYYLNRDGSHFIGKPQRGQNKALKGYPYWIELMICDHRTQSVMSGSDSSKQQRMPRPSLVLVILINLIKLY